MKHWYYILILALLTCAMNSCGGHADRASLVAIDSLIMQNPDSACELLAAYTADSLTTDDDRAYHALLTTIADYKAYRPITTDSVVNIAVNHYDHDGANQDKRMRSLLYKGCVMEELGDSKSAMRHYKEAQYACPDNDNFHKGYIHFRIASLYQDNFKSLEAIKHYQLALQEFYNYKMFLNSCYDNIGKLYISINIDSALIYTQQSLRCSRISNDSLMISKKYVDFAKIYYLKKEYIKAKHYALSAINFNPNVYNETDAYFILCESYLKLHNVDSAQLILNDAPPSVSLSDSLQLLTCFADIAEANNSYSNSQEYSKKIDSINKTIDKKVFNNTIVFTENEIDLKQEQKNAQKFMHSMFFWSIALFIIFAVLFCIHIIKQRSKFNKAQSQIHVLSGQITDFLVEIEYIKGDQGAQAIKNKKDKSLLEKRIQLVIESLDHSIGCYSNILGDLLKEFKVTSSQKNKKIRNLMTPDFFVQLRQVVNLRYDNLINKIMDSEIKLTEEEINIICMDLCKFPNPILWTYSNCDRYKSLLNKKKIIASKVFGADNIQDIPKLFLTK